MLPITKDTQIEDLVEQLPLSVSLLREKGIVCIVCGEPVWGSLNDLATQKGLSVENIDQIVKKLNEMLLEK
jgi:iron-sulfur cluster repair protein YtfE (RIC family)